MRVALLLLKLMRSSGHRFGLMVERIPKLMKLVMAQAGGEASERVFWIVPMVAVMQTVR